LKNNRDSLADIYECIKTKAVHDSDCKDFESFVQKLSYNEVYPNELVYMCILRLTGCPVEIYDLIDGVPKLGSKYETPFLSSNLTFKLVKSGVNNATFGCLISEKLYDSGESLLSRVGSIQ